MSGSRDASIGAVVTGVGDALEGIWVGDGAVAGEAGDWRVVVIPVAGIVVDEWVPAHGAAEVGGQVGDSSVGVVHTP
jgi:hypothetical protein